MTEALLKDCTESEFAVQISVTMQPHFHSANSGVLYPENIQVRFNTLSFTLKPIRVFPLGPRGLYLKEVGRTPEEE